MTKPIVKIVDLETGTEIEREMTVAEFKQYEADQLATQQQKDAETAKAAEKSALLAKLGITEDEAKLLLS